jgi:hypothetical protein
VTDVLNNHSSESQFLGKTTFLKTALHDTATLFVLTDFDRPGHTSSEDEICELLIAHSSIKVRVLRLFRSSKLRQENLNNVVPVVVCAKHTGIFFKLLDHFKELEMKCTVGEPCLSHSFDQGLHNARAVSVYSHVED